MTSLVPKDDLGNVPVIQVTERVMGQLAVCNEQIDLANDVDNLQNQIEKLQSIRFFVSGLKIADLIVEASIVQARAKRKLFELLPPTSRTDTHNEKGKATKVIETAKSVGLSYNQLKAGRRIWSPPSEQKTGLTDNELTDLYEDCRKNKRPVTDKMVLRQIRLKNGKPVGIVQAGQDREKRDVSVVPEHLIEVVRSTMGEITLDPASSNEAQKVVKATKYYTPENDGLDYEKQWVGKIWLYPPVSERSTENFICKLDTSTFEQAIVLLSVNFKLDWFCNFLTRSKACCFLPDNKVVVGLKVDKKLFAKNFKNFGVCLSPIS